MDAKKRGGGGGRGGRGRGRGGRSRDGETRWKSPDGGWGWMVAIGAFLCAGLMSTMTLCYAILFSRFLMERGASTTIINWILNLHLVFHNLPGIFVGPLTKEVGFRRVAFIASLLACLCFLALVFVNSIWYLLVFFSACGIFMGLAIRSCDIILPLYFDRRRGLANAFQMAGICTGQFAGPLLIRYLLDEYSLQGAILIVGGIILNSLVGASLFQPVEWHLKPVMDEEMSVELGKEDSCQFEEEVRDKMGTPNGTAKPDTNTHKYTKSSTNTKNISECSNLSSAGSCFDLTSSVTSSTSLTLDQETEVDEISKTTPSLILSCSGVKLLITTLRAVKCVSLGVLSDLVIVIQSRRAIIIVTGGVCSMIAYFSFIVMVPFAVLNAGYSLSDAAWCVSLSIITSTFARLLTSLLSDCPWFNMQVAYMTGTGIMAVSSSVFGFLADLTWMQIVIAAWGYGLGMMVSLSIIIIPKVMGLDQMAAVYGTRCLMSALAFLTIGPLIGVIRDVSDSYKVAMMAIGALASLSVLMWSFMPAAVERDRTMDEEQRTKKEEREEMKEAIGGLRVT